MKVGRPVFVYGGTFDPIHVGHLRSAIEVGQLFGDSMVTLVPSYIPPHRDRPSATAEQRLQMLTLAANQLPFVEVDTREIQRAGVSYTIDTLKALREEIGRETCLSLIIGLDSFVLLHEWHNWREITDYANLIVIERPGYEGQQPLDEVLQWVQSRPAGNHDQLLSHARGIICRLSLSQLEISASDIRSKLRKNESVRYLVPEEVIEYIEGNKLYQSERSNPR